MKNLFITLFLFFLFSFSIANAQEYMQKYYPEKDPLVLAQLEKWQDIKFGLLMHWGPYSQWGIVESWSICAEDEDWCRRKIDNYTEYKKQYEGLKSTFNPVKFDPTKWAAAAKDAGMKYVVFTTKHHDGFTMFDSKQTDYKITDPGCPFSTNPKANVAKEIFSSFRNEGFMVGAYFSKPDWHNENYWWPNFATPDRNVNYDVTKYPDHWQKYVEFTHKQIMELMTDYGKMDILWLDGGWVKKMSDEQVKEAINSKDYKFTRIQNQDINMSELVKKAREKQPGLIVVDRAVEGPNQNYLTPENQVPGKLLPYPWESCIIMGGGWSYVFNAKYKSPGEVVHLLVDIVSKGGNLLLNIAPSPEGTWDDGAYATLKGVGEWMKVNSEAIYNSRPYAPYKEEKVWFTQNKDGKTIYAVYLPDENEKQLPKEISIPAGNLDSKVKMSLLGDKGNLKCKKEGEKLVVSFSETVRKNFSSKSGWVIKITGIK
jgi:alpha-L-fucosidase